MKYNFDSIRFSYDQFGELRESDFYVCRMDGTRLYCLNGVDMDSISFNPKIRDIGTLSFDVNKYIDEDGELVESNGYSYLEDKMVIEVENVGKYIIDQPPTITVDGNGQKKNVVCYSYEYNLIGQFLTEFVINCGTDTSRERLISCNLNEDGTVKSSIKYIKGYDEFNPELSLVSYLLEKMPFWKVGYVDGDFANSIYSFNIKSQSVYGFLTQDFTTTTKCFCVFNTCDMTINIVKNEDFGRDTGILFSSKNIVSAYTKTPVSTEIYNRYTIKGGDGVENILPYLCGDTKLECFDYFLDEKHMPLELIRKYKTWRDFRDEKATGDDKYRRKGESYRDAYARIYLEEVQAREKRDEIKNRVPSGSLETTWKNIDLSKLEEELQYFNVFVTSIKMNKKYFVNGVFSEEKLKNTNMKDYVLYYEYVTYVIPFIIEAMNNKGNEEYEQSEDWIYDIELYGVDECLVMMEKYKNEVDALGGDYSKDYFSLSTVEKEKVGKQVGLYRINHEKYVEAYNNYIKFYDLYFQRLDEYNKYDLEYLRRTEYLKEIASICSKENELFGFTEDDLDLLESLCHDGTYENKNFVASDKNDIENIMEQQNKLFELAKNEIYITSRPQYSVNLDIDNILGMEEYKDCVEDFKIGNIVEFEDEDGYISTLRIVGFDLNPKDYYNKMVINLSDSQLTRNGYSDLAWLLNQAVSASSNSVSSSTDGSGLDADGLATITKLIKEIIAESLASDVSQAKINTKEIINNQLTLDYLMNKLTNGGQDQGIYMVGDTLYINCAMIDAEKIQSMFADIGGFIIGDDKLYKDDTDVGDGIGLNSDASNGLPAIWAGGIKDAADLSKVRVYHNGDAYFDGKVECSNLTITGGEFYDDYTDNKAKIQEVYTKMENGEFGGGGASSTTRFYIRYSANEDGSNMTIAPTGESVYMGTLTLDHEGTEEEISTPSNYTWMKVKGEPGEQGTPGLNGTSSYTHIKYSNDGETFTSNNGEDFGTWIGILIDNIKEDSTTFSDYSWHKYVGNDGEDAYTLFLSNENYTFGGTISTAINEEMTTDVIGYKGTLQISTNVASISGVPDGMEYEINNDNTTNTSITFRATTEMTSPSGILTISIKMDNKTFIKRFSYSVAFRGDTGEPSTVYSLMSDTKVLKMNSDGSFYPETINLSVQKHQGLKPLESANGYIAVYMKNSDEDTLDVSPDTLLSQLAYTIKSGTQSIKCVLYVGVDGTKTVADEQIIPVVSDGSIANTLDIYTSTNVVPFDGDGNLKSSENIVLRANQQGFTDEITWSTEPSVTLTPDSSDQYKMILSPSVFETNDSVKVTITSGKYSDTTTIVKISDGTNGESAEGTHVYIRYSANKDGTNFVEVPTTLTKYIGVCTSSLSTAPTSNTAYQWSRYVGDTGVSSYLTIRYSENADGTGMTEEPNDDSKYMGFYHSYTSEKPTDNTKYTWVKIKGEESYSIVLSNENHTFAGDQDSALASSAQCYVTAYYGTTWVPCTIGTITGMSDGMSVSIADNGTRNASFTVNVNTTMTNKNGSLTIPITINDKEFTKTFTYSLVLDGKKGADGISVVSTDVIYYKSTSNTEAPVGYDTTPPATGWVTNPSEITLTNGTYLWSVTITKFSDDTSSCSYPVCIANGNGDKSISFTEEYAINEDKDNAPTSGWTTDNTLKWSIGKYIWTRTKIVHTRNDGTTDTEWTTPLCHSEWEAVNNIAVGGENIVSNLSNNWDNIDISSSGVSSTSLIRVSSVEKYTVLPETEYTLTTYGDILCMIHEWNGDTHVVSGEYVDGAYTFTTSSTTNFVNFTIKYNPEATILPTTIGSNYKLKFEKGNKASDFSYSYSDIKFGIDSKNTIYRQDDEPTGGDYKNGDMWMDTDDGNKIYTYEDGTWSLKQLGSNAIADGAITAAKADIDEIFSHDITATGTIKGARVISGVFMSEDYEDNEDDILLDDGTLNPDYRVKNGLLIDGVNRVLKTPQNTFGSNFIQTDGYWVNGTINQAEIGYRAFSSGDKNTVRGYACASIGEGNTVGQLSSFGDEFSETITNSNNYSYITTSNVIRVKLNESHELSCKLGGSIKMTLNISKVSDPDGLISSYSTEVNATEYKTTEEVDNYWARFEDTVTFYGYNNNTIDVYLYRWDLYGKPVEYGYFTCDMTMTDGTTDSTTDRITYSKLLNNKYEIVKIAYKDCNGTYHYADFKITLKQIDITIKALSQFNTKCAIAIGTGLEALYSNQLVCGRYNKNSGSTLFEIGCGTASSRMNAFEVKTDGTTSINGYLYMNNGTVIYGRDTDGNGRTLCGINTSNQYVFAIGGFSNEIIFGTQSNTKHNWIRGDYVHLDAGHFTGSQLTHSGDAFYPDKTNTVNSGTNALRWMNCYVSNTVYAGTGSINTSDMRKKEIVDDTMSHAHDLIMGLETYSCKYKGDLSTSGRVHDVLSAQNLRDVLYGLGIDRACFTAQPNDDNKPLEECTEDELTYGIRYTELIPPIIKVIQEFESRISALESER